MIFKNIISKTDALLHPDELPSLKKTSCIVGGIQQCPSCLAHTQTATAESHSLESTTPFKLKLNPANKFLIVGPQSTGKLHFTQVAAWELSS